jgi:hypothetical protein
MPRVVSSRRSCICNESLKIRGFFSFGRWKKMVSWSDSRWIKPAQDAVRSQAFMNTAVARFRKKTNKRGYLEAVIGGIVCTLWSYSICSELNWFMIKVRRRLVVDRRIVGLGTNYLWTEPKNGSSDMSDHCAVFRPPWWISNCGKGVCVLSLLAVLRLSVTPHLAFREICRRRRFYHVVWDSRDLENLFRRRREYI